MASRAEGSVRQLKSGRWQIRYWVDGERKNGEKTFTTQKEAEKALRTIQVDLDRGDYFDESRGEMTFAEFAREYIEKMSAGKQPGTVANWRSQLNTTLLPTFGPMKMRNIRVRHVDAWWQAHPPTQNRRNSYFTLRKMMRYGVRWEVIRQNPCDIEGAGKDESKPRPTYSVEDFKLILKHAPEDYHVALWVAYSGSLRIGEVAGLNRGDFDAQTGVLHVERQFSERGGMHLDRTKSGQIKDVPLYGEGLRLLREHVRQNLAFPTAPIFTTSRGRRMSARHLRLVWNAARELAGYPDFRVHDARHTSLTAWSQLPGVTVKDVQKRAGHEATPSWRGPRTHNPPDRPDLRDRRRPRPYTRAASVLGSPRGCSSGR